MVRICKMAMCCRGAGDSATLPEKGRKPRFFTGVLKHPTFRQGCRSSRCVSPRVYYLKSRGFKPSAVTNLTYKNQIFKSRYYSSCKSPLKQPNMRTLSKTTPALSPHANDMEIQSTASYLNLNMMLLPE